MSQQLLLAVGADASHLNGCHVPELALINIGGIVREQLLGELVHDVRALLAAVALLQRILVNVEQEHSAPRVEGPRTIVRVGKRAQCAKRAPLLGLGETRSRRGI